MTLPLTAPKIRRVSIPIDRGDADMTFLGLLREFYKAYGEWGYSRNTVDLYERHGMAFLAFIKSQRLPDDLRSFNDRTVYDFAAYLLRGTAEGGCGVHPNTVIGVLSGLSSLARYGMQRTTKDGRRLLSENPTQSFRWPQKQMQETKYLLPGELAKLVDVEVPVFMGLARDVLVETGIRVSEACALNVGSLKHVNGRWYLAIIVKRRGDRRKVYPVDIPIPKALGEELRNTVLLREAKQQEPEWPLLLTSEGIRWNRRALSNMLARLGRMAGITRLAVSAHKLRHTRETMDRLGGMDRVVQAKLRGRTTTRSLERYDHVLPEELAEASDLSTEATRAYLGRVRPQRQNQQESAEVTPPEAPPNTLSPKGIAGDSSA